jgi:hypothetical protein
MPPQSRRGCGAPDPAPSEASGGRVAAVTHCDRLSDLVACTDNLLESATAGPGARPRTLTRSKVLRAPRRTNFDAEIPAGDCENYAPSLQLLAVEDALDVTRVQAHAAQ